MPNGLVELFNQLNEPFAYEEYKANYEGYSTVGPQSIADRLNQVLGIYNWEHDIRECKEDRELFTVSVLGLLKVRDPENGEWVSRTQFGDKRIQKKNEMDQPTPQAFLDGKKAAVSDSLKKCAALFGVASDVYKGRIKAVKAKNSNGESNKMYLALAAFHQLDITYSNQFEHGIAILPDDYKQYYNNKNWLGIFESDKGEAMKFWNQKHSGSGRETTSNSGQQNQQQLNGASRRNQSSNNTNPGEGGNSSSTQRSQTNNSSNQSNLEKELFEFVGMIADAHPTDQRPYFKLEFKNSDEKVDVYAIDGNVINFIEKINPQPGLKYSLKTQPGQNGKLILKRINSAAS